MVAFPARLRDAIAARGSGLTILVVRLGALGDIVRTLPAVRLIRAGMRDARIHWIAWEPWAQILEDHVDLDGVIGVPRTEWRNLARSPLGWPSLAAGLRGIASRVRGLRADLVLDFHGDFRTGVLGWLSGAPVRLGYEGHQQKEGNRLFTTHRVPAGARRTSRLERNLDLVSALGLATRPVPGAGIAIGETDEHAAQAVLRPLGISGEAYAVLNPGASRRQAYKKPPAPLFGAAARALADHGVAPIVVCGPGEDDDADGAVAASGGIARRAPATTLKALAALLRGARLFVGGDSGPLHLACGMGCPVVGLYGPTDPIVNTPWNVPFVALASARVVYTGIKEKDRAAGGFLGLAPDSVIDAIGTILKRRRDETAAPGGSVVL
jgi:ADP-heptose:LPS heptosyltransferase